VLVFLEDILREIADIFPCPIIHIGGEEAPRLRWDACPKCQARIAAENLSGSQGLQIWFVNRIAAFLKTMNRDIMGWDEILSDDTPSGATIHAWQNAEAGIAAAKSGHNTVMSPITDMYSWNDNHDYLPLCSMYHYEPVPAGLDSGMESFILGAEHCIWTEFIADQERLDYHAYARNCALAELDWTPRNLKSWDRFATALGRHYTRLANSGVQFFRDTTIPPDTSQSPFLIIPYPVALQPGESASELTPETVIDVSDSTRFAGEYFAAIVKQAAGFEPEVKTSLSAGIRREINVSFFIPAIHTQNTHDGLIVTYDGCKITSTAKLINHKGQVIATGIPGPAGTQKLSLTGVPAGAFLLIIPTQGAFYRKHITVIH
jgi:hypothetical protein